MIWDLKSVLARTYPFGFPFCACCTSPTLLTPYSLATAISDNSIKFSAVSITTTSIIERLFSTFLGLVKSVTISLKCDQVVQGSFAHTTALSPASVAIKNVFPLLSLAAWKVFPVLFFPYSNTFLLAIEPSNELSLLNTSSKLNAIFYLPFYIH